MLLNCSSSLTVCSKPELLESSNMKYRKKANETKARYRRATKRIALNLHAALRMGILATKRNEISAIKRSRDQLTKVILHPSKTYRKGESTVYEMWQNTGHRSKHCWIRTKERTVLLNHITLSNWFKSLMVACGFEHHWFNLHRLRSFGGDALAMAGANELEMMAHGDGQVLIPFKHTSVSKGVAANLASIKEEACLCQEGRAGHVRQRRD